MEEGSKKLLSWVEGSSLLIYGNCCWVKYLVGDPRYGAMDPTKEPLLVTV
jgi:hypothetical protein